MESIAGQFITWDMLGTFASLVAIVFMVVEFTKELPYIKSIKTKYYSMMVAFVLILLFSLQSGSFEFVDIVLYVLSAITISLTGSGLSDFTNPVDKSKKE